LLSILLLAGPLKSLVVSQRWVMYSLFIGLTFGGVPIVWKMARPVSPSLVVSGVIAFLAMIGLAVLQAFEVVGGGSGNIAMFFIAGLAGASAMILPGLSGGYLLLLLGQYVPILSAIDTFKEALKARDIAAALDPALSVMLPVGIGVVLGVAVVGNLLQWLLVNRRQATLGALLGLLIGSTAGLWPFQHGVEPMVGDQIKGQLVTAESIAEIDPEDWKTEYFAPSALQVFSALALVAVGFGVTLGVAKVGGEE
jgi:putative membrane protein